MRDTTNEQAARGNAIERRPLPLSLYRRNTQHPK
jgi:hypothetical protein